MRSRWKKIGLSNRNNKVKEREIYLMRRIVKKGNKEEIIDEFNNRKIYEVGKIWS